MTRWSLWRALAVALGGAFLLNACATENGREAAEGAASISLAVPNAASVASHKVAYDCDGRSIEAEYVNAADVSLAALTLDQEYIVAAQVMSASGARYAGGRYIWWTKGDEADLYDLTEGEDAPKLHCRAVEEGRSKG